MVRAPVSRASVAVTASAVSSASRLRHSGTTPPSSRPAARRSCSARSSSVDSSACTRHTASHAATARSSAFSSAGPWPGTPWVVQVKALMKHAPAAHTGATSSIRSGQACAASAKSTTERSARWRRLASRSSAPITGATCVCSTTVVTPARAAAALAVGKSSRSGSPGSMKWTCASTMPGITSSPPASTDSAASRCSAVTAAMRPSRTSTSARRRPPGSTTSPPRIARSKDSSMASRYRAGLQRC